MLALVRTIACMELIFACDSRSSSDGVSGGTLTILFNDKIFTAATSPLTNREKKRISILTHMHHTHTPNSSEKCHYFILL